jgi:peptidoglycan/LPS O-acetylase OafA/YrhL
MHWYWFGFTRLHIRSISLLIMVPLSVAFAWLYFRICERPFMTSASAVKAKPIAAIEQDIELARDVA